MTRHVEWYRTPSQKWGSSDFIEITAFYDGDVGLRLHECYDPSNPYADHLECADIVMGRRFALRQAFLLARFALGLARKDRHTTRTVDDG